MWPLNAAAAATKIIVNLTPTVITELIPAGPTDALVAFVMGNDGVTYQERTLAQTRTAINPPDWLDPAVGIGNYEVSVTFTGEAPLAGSDLSDGTWLSLSTERFWSQEYTSSASGDNTTVLTVSIRNANTLIVLASADYTLIAGHL